MVTEKRLIDANVAIKEMNAVDIHFWEDAEDGVEKCVNILYNAPTVDAVEVVRGRWEDVSLRFTQVKEKCTVCGGIVYAHGFNYCPHCGAKMDGERRTDNA